MFDDKGGNKMTCFETYQDLTHKKALPSNIGRLLLMRVVLILCQLLLVLISIFSDAITLPLMQMMIAITCYILVNLVSHLMLLRSKGLSERIYFTQLLIDILFLTLFLYFSGGYSNPFISLYLLPLIIVSSTMGRREVTLTAVIILLCYTVLVFFYHPLFVMQPHDETSIFHLHLLGMWFSFALSVGLIVFFIMRMTHSIQQRDQRLAEMREKAERDNYILALGAMAAGAAHELGTPLATMAVVSHELACDFKDNDEIVSQVDVMKAELERCKQVLAQLSSNAGQLRAEGGRKLKFDVYVHEITMQWHITRPHVTMNIYQKVEGEAPDFIADVTLTQALANLLNNAADASPQGISVNFGWDEKLLWLEVRDQGCGFPAYVLAHIGEPDISSKGTGRGLGLLLSKAVFERLGGSLKLLNPDDGGACARVVLPRFAS
ncbi:MAG: ATP-binding protein [Mariprofundaceae bacterium]|nr:ATP-binding protein [Mariprofundaceae bacterium]